MEENRQEIRNMICTVCPTGCALTVRIENGAVAEIAGNGCKRGIPYARAEVENPVRTLTTTVRVCGGDRPLLPVRSSHPVPRSSLREMVRVLNGITLSAPVSEGCVVLADILGSGVDIVASRAVGRV